MPLPDLNRRRLLRGGAALAALMAFAGQAAARPRDLSLRLHPLAGKLRTQAQSFEDQLAQLRVPRGSENWYEQVTGRKVVRRLEKGVDF